MVLKRIHFFALFHFLLINQALFTYVLSSMGLSMWKQILFTMLGIIILFQNLVNLNKVNFFIIFLFLLSFVPLPGLITRTENLYGFLYFLLPFYVYPVYFKILKNFSLAEWNDTINFLEWAGLYLSVGFIYDFFTRDFAFLSHNITRLDHTYRPVFTLGTSTLLFLILSAPIVIRNVLEQKPKFLTYVYICVSLIAVFCSGSRAALILYSLFVGIYVFKVNKLYFWVFGLIGLLALLTSDLSRYINLFSASDPGNHTRFNYWVYFFKSFTSETLFVGSGLGSAYSDYWPHPSRHFESDVIFIYFQSGILGLMVLSIFIVGYFWNIRTLTSYVWYLFVLMQIFVSPTLANYCTVSILSLVLIAHLKTTSQTEEFKNENFSCNSYQK